MWTMQIIVFQQLRGSTGFCLAKLVPVSYQSWRHSVFYFTGLCPHTFHKAGNQWHNASFTKIKLTNRSMWLGRIMQGLNIQISLQVLSPGHNEMLGQPLASDCIWKRHFTRLFSKFRMVVTPRLSSRGEKRFTGINKIKKQIGDGKNKDN